MRKIFEKSLDYLQLKVPNFKVNKQSKLIFFTCPYCGGNNCNFIPFTFEGCCIDCKTSKKKDSIGTVIDWVRHLESDKVNWTEESILYYLADLFKMNYVSSSEVDKAFKLFKLNNFDLVPIIRNGKIPIEKEWTTREHKDPTEWKGWIETGINIGVKTGKISNITILDIDTKMLDPKLSELLLGYKGIIQESTKGYHYFFQYDSELPKTRIDEFKLDIENNGGQVVIFPSIIDEVQRKFLQTESIPKMSGELKNFLLSKISNKPIESIQSNEIVTDKSKIDLDFVNEGNRTNFIMKFGGVVRKELSLPQTSFILNLFNKYFFKPSLSMKELDNVVKSLDKYIQFDYHDLAKKVLNYLKIVGDATERDIQEITGEKKEIIGKALAFLVKEGMLQKHWKTYHIIKKADWKDIFPQTDFAINFKVPYFEPYAHFNWGDMVLLGSKSKWGKTTISMNIVKKLVEQGIKPYYISLETGSRFIKTAMRLGMKEGDLWWDFQADPTKIELEKNAVTIIDWLLIDDKSQTDSVLKHFVEQLYKSNGFLIIFMQLKKDGTWFAPNMVEQFPALGARYLYKTEDDGTYGNWYIEPIREPRQKYKKCVLPCSYDFDTKILSPIDEETKTQEGVAGL